MVLFLLAAAAVGVWYWLSQNQSSAPSATSIPMSDLTPTNSNSTSGNPPSGIQKMAQAIYEFEGGGKPGATNQWNNNPGNIGGGQATYPTQQQGWNALYSYIERHVQAHPDWTFQNFFAYYLTGDPQAFQPTNQGNPQTYASYVAGKLGTTPGTTVSSVVS